MYINSLYQCTILVYNRKITLGYCINLNDLISIVLCVYLLEKCMGHQTYQQNAKHYLTG